MSLTHLLLSSFRSPALLQTLPGESQPSISANTLTTVGTALAVCIFVGSIAWKFRGWVGRVEMNQTLALNVQAASITNLAASVTALTVEVKELRSTLRDHVTRGEMDSILAYLREANPDIRIPTHLFRDQPHY